MRPVYAGGNFSSAGGQPARIARAKVRLPQHPPITAIAIPDTIEYGQQSELSVAGGAGTGAVSYTVTAGVEFCSVNDDILTGIGVGICTVMASKASDANYYADSDTVDVTITPAGNELFKVRFEDL